MAGTEAYHEVPQPYRIQKRLALNRCFRAIRQSAAGAKSLVYITLGGEDIYDVMDLVGVFDIGEVRLTVLSFEQDKLKAQRADTCPVARTLRRVDSVTLGVLNREFPARLDRLMELRDCGRFVYFLDYTGTFSFRQGDAVAELLTQGLIRAGDFLLVTSCLSPRIVHQDDFMLGELPRYRLLWPGKKMDHALRVRNHVEVILAAALDSYRKVIRATDLTPVTLGVMRKFRYRDSKTPMGLWAFAVRLATIQEEGFPDLDFQDFPTAFRMPPEDKTPLPDLFTALKRH